MAAFSYIPKRLWNSNPLPGTENALCSEEQPGYEMYDADGYLVQVNCSDKNVCGDEWDDLF